MDDVNAWATALKKCLNAWRRDGFLFSAYVHAWWRIYNMHVLYINLLLYIFQVKASMMYFCLISDNFVNLPSEGPGVSIEKSISSSCYHREHWWTWRMCADCRWLCIQITRKSWAIAQGLYSIPWVEHLPISFGMAYRNRLPNVTWIDWFQFCVEFRRSD